jgi:rRNA processing protein Gar1|tara:strand:+ start:609 stop:806 length:198 start_codon:yes stop_codon:yes gene_type:complete
MLKIYDEVKHAYNEKRIGIVYEIHEKWNEPYLVVWKPTSEYDVENHGYVWEWCNEKELKKERKYG